MIPHLFEWQRTRFVLWRPRLTVPAPRLVIGWYQAGNLQTDNLPYLSNRQEWELAEFDGCPGLWGISATDCGLVEGNVYHYWFEVNDSSPYRPGRRILCTDPLARTVDWRLRAGQMSSPYNDDDLDPASVVKYLGGELVPCDAAGELIPPVPLLPTEQAPANNQMVIYELPTSWTQTNSGGETGVAVGTFRDVAALVDSAAPAANFAGVAALDIGRSHIMELGINALELLPPTDSFAKREWGYAPSNYFAPDFDLGMPEGHNSPTANIDLAKLITLLHSRGIRFIADLVMAFGTHAPMENVNFADFHIDPSSEPGDADALQSGNSSGKQERRDGFGGKLWRYSHLAEGYDPLDGQTRQYFPARQYMKLFLLRWMEDFALDGLRLDSVNNIANWDFVQEFKDLARDHWANANSSPDRFLVVGEELSVPKGLITQNRLDGLWNEDFKKFLRCAILGTNHPSEQSFEWTVRKMIDCRLMGFADGSQAVNYVGSHDVEGNENVRLFNYLLNHGVVLTEERIKLAFVCLLTAVGVPMILAGDEFADQHDLGTSHPDKQRDSVNFGRMEEPWRKRVFDYVATLVKLRTDNAALGSNDTDFIHVDFSHGKRVMVWKRGKSNSTAQVVVVANFSDYGSGPDGEYRITNWPDTPAGLHWREMTQGRDIPMEWAGREGVYPWEAKVYTLAPTTGGESE